MCQLRNLVGKPVEVAQGPVRVRAMEMNDLLESSLLEEAGRDAGAVTDAAVDRHRSFVRDLRSVMRYVGYVHVDRTGCTAPSVGPPRRIRGSCGRSMPRSVQCSQCEAADLKLIANF